jgi:hypothetical protein
VGGNSLNNSSLNSSIPLPSGIAAQHFQPARAYRAARTIPGSLLSGRRVDTVRQIFRSSNSWPIFSQPFSVAIALSNLRSDSTHQHPSPRCRAIKDLQRAFSHKGEGSMEDDRSKSTSYSRRRTLLLAQGALVSWRPPPACWGSSARLPRRLATRPTGASAPNACRCSKTASRIRASWR